MDGGPPSIDDFRPHMIQLIHMKALVMHSFMFDMNERDMEVMVTEVKPSNLEISYSHKSDITKSVVTRYGQASGSWVYKVYLEYRMQESQDDMDSGVGKFKKFECGQYEHKFLLGQEDMKLQFKRWMWNNIRKLCVNLSQAFLDKMLKHKVGP